MTSKAKFFGGAKESSFSATYLLGPRMPRLQVLSATTTGLSVALLDARSFNLGGPHFAIVNVGANSFNLVNNSLTTLTAVAVGKMAIVWLSENTTSAGVWKVKVTDATSAVNPSPGLKHYVAGGQYTSTPLYQKTIEYDQQLDIVSLKTDAPVVLTGDTQGATFPYGATMHFTGGQVGLAVSNKNLQYDPDVWSTDTVMPDQMGNHAGAQIGAKGYVFGGRDNATGNTSTTRRRAFELSAGAWATMSSRASGRELYESGAATGSNSKIYLTGGRGGPGTVSSPKNIVDEYVSDAYSVRQGRPLPSMATNTTVAMSDYIYSFCGSDGTFASFSTMFNDVVRYSIALDLWESRTVFPILAFGMSGSSIGDVAALIGGTKYVSSVSFPPSNQNVAYSHATDVYASKVNLASTLNYATNSQQAVNV